MAESGRLAYLLRLREELLQEMAEADGEVGRVRIAIERMESDLRIGRPEPADYSRTKGQLLPQAERRVLEAFQNLLKVEDKINAERG